MKLVILRELLLELILLTYFIPDAIPTQVIEFSDNNALTIIDPKDPSIPTAIPSVTTTPNNTTMLVRQHNKPSIKRRRRLRRKKKRIQVNKISTTTIPSQINFTTKTTLGVTKTKSPKRKKLPNQIRRKHKRRRNRKGNIVASTTAQRVPLQSKNLVLPIAPPGTTKVTRPSQKRGKETIRCNKNNGGCAHICQGAGAEKCGCFRGFTLAKDRHTCIDINECLINKGNCEMNCTNTVGSFQCHCPRGWRLSIDSRSCEDVNECLLRNGHGPCQDRCENIRGGYKCSCVRFKGTKLGSDLHSCLDMDECAKDNGGCSHLCINTFGRSFCSCPEGLELSADFKTCRDINECDSESIKNSCPNGCINTLGSYRCASPFDFQNDQSYNEVVCKPLFPPQNGYFKCSRKHALKTFAKSGRKRVKNSLGTKCILVCPAGFKRRGKGFRISCGYGGEWVGNMDAKCVPA